MPVCAPAPALVPVLTEAAYVCSKVVVPVQEVASHKAEVVEPDMRWQLKHMSLVGAIDFWPEVEGPEERPETLGEWDERAFIGSYTSESASLEELPVSPKKSIGIPTTDSWLASEFPSLYVKVEDDDDEENSVDESVGRDEYSPMSSTETLVEREEMIGDAGILEKVEEVEMRKVHTLRQAPLVPLHLAQMHHRIKYRPEGFEMAEAQVRGETRAWWISC